MKSKLQLFDLTVCLIWIISIFGARSYWNPITFIFISLLVMIRLTVSFALIRKEKKTWISLVAYALTWLLGSALGRFYNGIGELGDYFFELTRLEYNHIADLCIAGAFALWIIVIPYVWYLILLFRHKLEDTGMTKKELFGSILWHHRSAKYFCAATMLTYLCMTAGLLMQPRLCMTMCFIASPLLYWLIGRYYSIKAEKVWSVILGVVCFWYAQTLGGVFRVLAFTISFGLIAYVCIYLYRCTKSHYLTAISMVFLAIILPSLSIGYNQYRCINYPRSGNYYLDPYRGILRINNTTNGKLVGLRDRYGLLVEPEYESIVPNNKSYYGWTYSYKLQKDGYSRIYDVYKNEILPPDYCPKLQKQLCNILEGFFEINGHDLGDKGEISVTEIASNKTIGHAIITMSGNPIKIYDREDYLPQDSATIKVNEFARNDSVMINKYTTKNILRYTENLPNDSIAKYQVYVRLFLDRQPEEGEMKEIVNSVRNLDSNINR